MQYCIDPKTSNKLSALGFGCMRFPRSLNTRIDMAKAEKLVMSAIERGVNYFDTAYSYFGSEEALGEILDKNSARAGVFLATKLPYQRCKTYDDFDALFGVQLKRLRTDYIDYYLIHNLSEVAIWNKLCELGIERWIEAKKASGQIRRVGFSFHGAQKEFTALIDAYPWDFCQIQYNYMNENYQAGRVGLKSAYAKGMAVIVMEPLLGGKLANGLPDKAANLFKEAGGAAHGAPAEWALRWLWDQPEVSVVLSGMNSEAQLDENIRTAETSAPGMLTAQDAEVFSKVIDVFSEYYKVDCTGCNYCMPCPNHVNIPGCFAAYNASYVTGFISGMMQYLTSTGANHPEKNYRGVNCTKCGHCTPLCPQHIEIPKMLEAVNKRLEPFWVRGTLNFMAARAKH